MFLKKTLRRLTDKITSQRVMVSQTEGIIYLLMAMVGGLIVGYVVGIALCQ